MVGARFLSAGDGSYKREKKKGWDEFCSTGLELETLGRNLCLPYTYGQIQKQL